MSDAWGTPPGGQETPSNQGQSAFPGQPSYQQPAPGAFPQSSFPAQPAGEPDWQALADEHEATGKRKRLLTFGIVGLVAVAAIGGILAVAMIHKGPGPGPVATSSPSPTPTGPTTPLEVISSDKYDTSSIDATAFFPDDTITLNGVLFTRTATTNTAANHCEEPVTADLGQLLKDNGCGRIHRATYLTATGIGVTIGVADFPTADAATKVKANATGTLLSLSGAGKTPYFCHGVNCMTSQGALGRFAYFAVAGKTDNSAAAQNDNLSVQAVRSLLDYEQQVLLKRGQTELGALRSPSATPSASPSH